MRQRTLCLAVALGLVTALFGCKPAFLVKPLVGPGTATGTYRPDQKGTLTVSFQWPQESAARYQTARVPASADTVRIRVFGREAIAGTTLRFETFLRRPAPGQDFQQVSTTLHVESNLLVEARAYRETFDSEASNNYGLANIWDGTDSGNTAGPRRIIAEGRSENVQINYGQTTPVQLRMEGSFVVAGIGGAAGWSFGDDPGIPNFQGTARFAELNLPNNIRFNRQGMNSYVYFTEDRRTGREAEGMAIRRLSFQNLNSGVLQFISGYNSTQNIQDSANLLNPEGVVYHAASNRLFIADTSRHRIQIFNLSTNAFQAQPLAGTGTAANVIHSTPQTAAGSALNFPRALRLSSNGNILFVSEGLANGRIQAINVGSSNVTLNVEVNRATTTPSRTVSLAPGQIVTVVGGGSDTPNETTFTSAFRSGLTVPRGLCATGDGRYLYVVDSVGGGSLNGRNYGFIKRWDMSTGAFELVAGESAPSQERLSTVATASIGNVETADVPPMDKHLEDLRSVAVGPDGNVYFTMDDRVCVISNGTVGTVAGTRSNAFSNDAGTAGDGLSVVPSDAYTDQIRIQFDNPNSIVFDANNGMYVMDAGNHRLRYISAGAAIGSAGVSEMSLVAGSSQGAADGTGFSIQFNAPFDIAINGSTAYVAEQGNNQIRLLALNATPGGDATVTAAVTGGGNNTDPRALAIGDGRVSTQAHVDSIQGMILSPDGNQLLFTEADNQRGDRIRRINGLTTAGPWTIQSLLMTAATDIGAPLRWMQGLNGMAFRTEGARDVLYLAFGQNNSTVTRFEIPTAITAAVTATGSVPPRYVGTGQSGYNYDGIRASLVQINNPTKVRVDGQGRIFFIDSGNGRVRMVQPGTPTTPGIITTVAGGGTRPDDNGPASAAQLDGMIDIDLDSRGFLYILQGDRVRRVDTLNNTISTILLGTDVGAVFSSFDYDETDNVMFYTYTPQPYPGESPSQQAARANQIRAVYF